MPNEPLPDDPAPDPQGREAPPEGVSLLGAVRASLSGRSYDYTKGPLGRSILLLAVPMVLEMLMESVFAVCDVFFVGRLGSEAVATVGLTESLLTLIYAVAIGLAMSTTAMVARRIGEGDPEGASRAATQAIGAGIFVAAAIGIPGAIFGSELLALLGATEQTVAVGGRYASLLLGTNVVILLLFLNNAIFRGAGDAVLAMRVLIVANGINLVLDPCLIFGLGPFPELGLTGAAVATTIGRGTGVLVQFASLRRGTGRVALRGPAVRFDLHVMLRLLRLSVGGIGQLLVQTASWVALMMFVAPFGADAVAGYTIAVRIIVFFLLPSWGLSNAAATLVGQNLGARQPERAERAVWLTGAANMAFLGCVTLCFLVFGDSLIAWFQDDAEVIAVGSDALRVIGYGYVVYAWGMVMMQAFNGAGDTTTPTWANLISFWVVQVPLAWTLAHGLELGPPGVFWSVTASETLLAAILITVFRRGRWKLRRV